MAQNRTCGTDQYHQEQIEDVRYANQYKKTKAKVKKKVEESVRFMTCTTIVKVPVAIHFSGSIDNSNIQCLEDASIAQIDVLNEDFAGANADISYYNDLVTSCPSTYPASALSNGACIEFCFAQFDHPSGYGLVDGDYAITIGEHSWPNAGANWAGYMNIFVEDNTGGLGIAPLYGGSNPNGNGFRVDASAFGGPGINCTSGAGINISGTYNLGRTATHEAGHYFGCSHTFAGCSDGDGFADTPNQSVANYGSPDVNLSNCLSNAENSCSTEDYFFNYMDYVNDAAMIMFTDDQATTMFATADHDNWGTTNCIGITPVSSFTPTTNQTICANSNQVTFTDSSLNFPTSWTWSVSGTGSSVVSELDSIFVVAFTQSGTFTVSLTATNNAGSDTATNSIVVTVLPSTDPACDLCDYELVMWDRRANEWSTGQSLDVEIDGVTTNYTGPDNGDLSIVEVLNVSNSDPINITINTGSLGLDQMSWRLFDEEGYVVIGGGDTFGIGPGNAQGGNAPTLDSVIDGEVKSGSVDCDMVTQCDNFTLTIDLDNYPDETAWQILDDQGNYVYQSLGYNGQSGTVTENFCLDNGCYDLYFIDYYGDGICCGQGNGSYELKRDIDDYIVASGGQFTGSETTSFCTDDGLCVDNLTTDQDVVTGIYVANIQVTSTGVVQESSIVEYYGGDTVSLNSGFETPANTDFSAINADCETYDDLIIITGESERFHLKETSIEAFTIEYNDKVIYNSREDSTVYRHTDGTVSYTPPIIKTKNHCLVTYYLNDGSIRVDNLPCDEIYSSSTGL